MEKWAAAIVAELHMNRITQRMLAKELGVTEEYVSMLLNGKAKSNGMEQRMRNAINAIAGKVTE